MGKLLYEKESYEIRGACFEIWKQFGGAFKEKVIEKSLAKEFNDRGLQVDQQKRIEIFYKGEKVGVCIPDFVINDRILFELKVKPNLILQDKKQFWNYLKGSDYRLGFLVNF